MSKESNHRPGRKLDSKRLNKVPFISKVGHRMSPWKLPD